LLLTVNEHVPSSTNSFRGLNLILERRAQGSQRFYALFGDSEISRLWITETGVAPDPSSSSLEMGTR